MIGFIKPSKPYDEQTYEERYADAMRWIGEFKAEWEAKEAKEREAARLARLAERPRAEVLGFPAQDRVLSEYELVALQARLDAAWQRTLDDKAERDAEQARKHRKYSHCGPGDPDWPGHRY